MINVTIDGQPLNANLQAIRTMADLVELIKATIDPELIINTLRIAGRDLSDADWRMPLTVQGNSTVEVTTLTKQAFLAERFSTAVNYVEHIINEFAYARSCFKEGSANDGNKELVTAVGDLQAFINWYTTVLSMITDEEEQQQRMAMFTNEISAIQNTCERLVQQQLYQSWWAMGETLGNELEPKLGDLRNCCSKLAENTM